VLHVYVDKGMRHGQKVTFEGESDEAPGQESGDVIIVLDEKPHDTFKRIGNNLYLNYKLPLIEALAGFAFTIKHLDGRELLVKSVNDVINPNEVRVIENEGMPTHKKPFEKGSLFIQFEIIFPKPNQLSKEQIKTLETLLPGRRPAPEKKEGVEFEEVTLKKSNETFDQKKSPSQQQHHQHSHSKEAYEEDDDEEGGQRRPQGVECSQS